MKKLNNIFSLKSGLSIEYHKIPYFKETTDTRCYHNSVEIYQGEVFLRCRNCKEPIDPMQWLIRIAEQERKMRYEFDRLTELNEKIMKTIDDKTRCKCEN